ncbi:MAG: CRTAC1 family protein [Gemmataceae bacterium]|nr:CRTAC1 family protein [Gemmataceae bacterium]
MSISPGHMAAWVVLGLSLNCPSSRAGDYPFSFKDVGNEAGIFPHAGGMRGHAAAWGDADNDGWPDLFIGTFHNAGSKPSVFLLNHRGKFTPSPQANLQTSGIGSGALFLDLNNSGRLDLYVSNCAHASEGVAAAPSLLFRNDGQGKFTDVSPQSGACPPAYSGRGLAALDFDGDGLLDLLACEQYYSSKVKTGAALYRNLGNHRFVNVAAQVGLPPGLGGLSVAAADVNLDGWPDIFLTSGVGDHRLLLNDGKGKFKEAPGAREVFQWKGLGKEDAPAGVCMADLNRDFLPDIVIGQHFKSPWTTPAPVRVYLNRGVKDGAPSFEEITLAAGLKPLAMKAPHVEIQDFDNDGWPDIYVSIVKFKEGKPCPVIFKGLGVEKGVPRFRDDAWGVNDFPMADDLATKRSGPFFEKMLREKKIIYMAAAPAGDFNRDGKLDIFLANWWIESRSLLLQNETAGGNWLDIRVEGKEGVNRMGIGTRINLYQVGKMGEAAALLGSREIAIGFGYCSGQEARAHFGLGQEKSVDVEVILPHGKGQLQKRGVKAGQMLTIQP